MEEKLTKELEEQISAAKSLDDVVRLCTDAGIPVSYVTADHSVCIH